MHRQCCSPHSSCGNSTCFSSEEFETLINLLAVFQGLPCLLLLNTFSIAQVLDQQQTTWDHLSRHVNMRWMEWGVVSNFKFVSNKPQSEFLTSRVEYCNVMNVWVLLSSGLNVHTHAHMITSTTGSPDVIHVICVLAQCVVLNTKWRTRNRGGFEQGYEPVGYPIL